MSESGHTATFPPDLAMSATPPIAEATTIYLLHEPSLIALA
jgi:hypothetical protein